MARSLVPEARHLGGESTMSRIVVARARAMLSFVSNLYRLEAGTADLAGQFGVEPPELPLSMIPNSVSIPMILLIATSVRLPAPTTAGGRPVRRRRWIPGSA